MKFNVSLFLFFILFIFTFAYKVSQSPTIESNINNYNNKIVINANIYSNSTYNVNFSYFYTMYNTHLPYESKYYLHKYHEYIFNNFFLQVLIIQWATIPSYFQVIYSSDDSGAFKEATEKVYFKGNYEGNINTIFFNQSPHVKKLRIVSNELFEIEKSYFYSNKETTGIILSNLDNEDICLYINDNSPSIDSEIEGTDCFSVISNGDNRELFVYDSDNYVLKHYNSNLCIGEKNKKIVLQKCDEKNSVYLKYLNKKFVVNDKCIIEMDSRNSFNNLIDEELSEVYVTSQNENYNKNNILVKGDSIWQSLPREGGNTIEEIVIYYNKNNHLEEKHIDKIFLIWKEEPSEFEVFSYNGHDNYWVKIGDFSNNIENTNEIEIASNIKSSGIKIKMIKTNYQAYSLKYIYIGYYSYRLQCIDISLPKYINYNSSNFEFVEQYVKKTNSKSENNNENLYSKINQLKELLNEAISINQPNNIHTIINYKILLTQYMELHKLYKIIKDKIGNKNKIVKIAKGTFLYPLESCSNSPQKINGFYHIKVNDGNKYNVFCDYSNVYHPINIYVYNTNFTDHITRKSIIEKCNEIGMLPLEINKEGILEQIKSIFDKSQIHISKDILIPIGTKYDTSSTEYYSFNSQYSPEISFYYKNIELTNDTMLGFRWEEVEDNQIQLIPFTPKESLQFKIQYLLCSLPNNKQNFSSIPTLKISCRFSISNNKKLFTLYNTQYLIYCPRKCNNPEYLIYGNEQYHEKSSICRAALHSDIDNNPFIITIKQANSSNYDGINSNGIESLELKEVNAHFYFTFIDNNLNKYSSFFEVEGNPIDEMVQKIQQNINITGNTSEQYDKAMDIVKDSIKLSEESANNITSKIEKIVNTINKETELNILKQENDLLKKKIKNNQKSKDNKIIKVKPQKIPKLKDFLVRDNNEIQKKPLGTYLEKLKYFSNETNEISEFKSLINNLQKESNTISLNINKINNSNESINKKIFKFSAIMEKLNNMIYISKLILINKNHIANRNGKFLANKLTKINKNKSTIINPSNIKTLFKEGIKSQKIYYLKYYLYQDFVIKCNFSLSKLHNKEILFRYQNEFNYYGVYLDKEGNKLSIRKTINGVTTEISSKFLMNNILKYSTFIIKVKANIIRITDISNNLILSTTDELNSFMIGTIGFFNCNLYKENYNIEIIADISSKKKKAQSIKRIQIMNNNSNYYNEQFTKNTLMINYKILNDYGKYQIKYRKGIICSINDKREDSKLILKNKNISQGSFIVSFYENEITYNESKIQFIFYYVSEIEYLYLSLEYLKNNKIKFTLIKKTNNNENVLKSKEIKEIPSKNTIKKSIHIKRIDNILEALYNNQTMILINIKEDYNGLIGLNPINIKCTFVQINLIPIIVNFKFTKEDTEHIITNKNSKYIVLPDIKKISNSFEYYSKNHPHEIPKTINDKIKLLNSITGDINLPYHLELPPKDEEQIKQIDSSYDYLKDNICFNYPSLPSQRDYCKLYEKNEIKKQKCLNNFCVYCCEESNFPKPNYTHQCIKKCQLKTEAYEESIDVTEYEETCLNSRNLIYSVCSSFSYNEDYCKYDICKLCCSSLEKIKGIQIRYSSIEKCFKLCKTKMLSQN